MGMLASPLCTQKKEASAARIDHSNRESSVSRSSHIPVTEIPVAMYLHKRKSSRDSKSLKESYSERKRTFAEHREVPDFLELRADKAAQEEQTALSKLADAEYHTRLLLEEQRNQRLSQARSEINIQ